MNSLRKTFVALALTALAVLSLPARAALQITDDRAWW